MRKDPKSPNLSLRCFTAPLLPSRPPAPPPFPLLSPLADRESERQCGPRFRLGNGQIPRLALSSLHLHLVGGGLLTNCTLVVEPCWMGEQAGSVRLCRRNGGAHLCGGDVGDVFRVFSTKGVVVEEGGATDKGDADF